METRCFLRQNRAAFLFGNTAPDVQVISGQLRQATHHFPYPIPAGQPPPDQVMLAAYPQLQDCQRLSPAQAAFIAGYLCHLHADWLWVAQIYSPIFGPGACQGEISRCAYLHNVLRAYLDRRVIPLLLQDTGACLEQVSPAGWLPFTEDRFLCQWRDFLASQLKPPVVVQTVEVFAARQGLSVEAFYRLLDSEERMEQEVFIHLSRSQLDAYRARLLQESVLRLRRYLEQPEAGAHRQTSVGVVMQ
jgi:hypothetical protein